MYGALQVPWAPIPAFAAAGRCCPPVTVLPGQPHSFRRCPDGARHLWTAAAAGFSRVPRVFRGFFAGFSRPSAPLSRSALWVHASRVGEGRRRRTADGPGRPCAPLLFPYEPHEALPAKPPHGLSLVDVERPPPPRRSANVVTTASLGPASGTASHRPTATCTAGGLERRRSGRQCSPGAARTPITSPGGSGTRSRAG